MISLRTYFKFFVVLAICACGSSAATNGANQDAGTNIKPATDGGTNVLPPSDAATIGEDATVGDAGTDLDAAFDAGPRIAPPLPTYSKGVCPLLVPDAGPPAPDAAPPSSVHIIDNFPTNAVFPADTQPRTFDLIVPPSYDGTQAWPVVFAWHWLNAGPGSMIDSAEMESAAEQMHFIAVIPDHLKKTNGDKVWEFNWPFVEGLPADKDAEFLFMEDMMACVGAQYKIDPARIYGIGVSAGALWATYLSTTPHVNHFAAIESLSGGLGADPLGVWHMDYAPQANKFPAIVLWGGDSDNLIILDFKAASIKYRDSLRADHHFVVECTHDAGHAVPPVDVPADGGTRFVMLWQFMLDHPYGTPADTSPYQESGLPSSFPSWCKITP